VQCREAAEVEEAADITAAAQQVLDVGHVSLARKVEQLSKAPPVSPVRAQGQLVSKRKTNLRSAHWRGKEGSHLQERVEGAEGAPDPRLGG
jgi:hypothetical protein